MKRLAIGALAVLVLSAGMIGKSEAQSFDAPPQVRLAQVYGPDVAEVYIDEYGRRVLIGQDGRIVGVEDPRRARFDERRERFDARRGGGRVYDSPPPPGVTVESRVGRAPQRGDDRGGYDRGLPRYPGRDDADTNSYGDPVLVAPDGDPYGREQAGIPPEPPVTSEPLAAPGDAGRTAALPGGDADLPPPGQSITATPAPGSEGRTLHESDPAPAVTLAKGKSSTAEVVALQVLLDRAGMSPGVIDGRMGSNVDKAYAAYQEKFGHTLPLNDPRALVEELDRNGGPAIVTYEITSKDAAGPYVAQIPSDYAKKAELPAMSYQDPAEMLAERFHMDEDYLKSINPGADFSRPGTLIKVAAVGPNVTGAVTKIIADKGREQVRAYDASGTLLAAYPSTIGSSETPSPSGTVQVDRIAFNPNYTYNPKINFKQGSNDKVLTVPPGPNGPVGSIWIALSKPTYGIHGTPEPSKIGKTNSHGCVRLTNWDATELAKMVKPGVTVQFVD